MKNLFELPTESYVHLFQGREFEINPLSDKVREHLRAIVGVGGTINPIPEINPTSVFVSLNLTNMPVDKFNYKVVGVEMNLHLNLIGKHKDFDERLEKFIYDTKRYISNYINLPENSMSENFKCTHVINAYEY